MTKRRRTNIFEEDVPDAQTAAGHRFEKGIEEEEYIRYPIREDSSLAERLSGKERMEGRPGAGTVKEQNALSAVHVARVKGVK